MAFGPDPGDGGAVALQYSSGVSDPTRPCPASDGDHAVDPTEPPVTRDPWEKAGWLMAAIWLVFLAFPLIAVFAVTENPWLRTANVLVILTFAGVYTLSFVRLPECNPARLPRHAATYLPILVGLIVIAGLTIRSNALSMGAYVVAFSVYAMPLRLALFSIGTILSLATVLPLLDTSEGPPWWMYDLIILLVAVACLIPKQLDERAERKRARDKSLTLAAERDRVARDVHDVLGHSLTVITVKSELAERLVDLDPARAKDEVAQVRSIARQALAEIRATVAGLRVARLADELTHADEALRGAGIAADLPDDPDVVDPRHRITMAWALREAVTNVVRHTNATTCTVRWTSDSLLVSDDGRGTGSKNAGNGITGLRERVAHAGGDVTLGPGSDGVGTQLEVRL
jgi:two-component system sensor histidine kinase DesK